MSYKWPTIQTKGDEPVTSNDLELADGSTFRISSRFLFPVNIQLEEENLNYWQLCMSMSDLIDSANAEGVSISNKGNNKFAYIYLHENLPCGSNKLSYLMHMIMELDSIIPLKVTFDQGRLFLDIDELESTFCCYKLEQDLAFLTYSTLQAGDEIDDNEETAIKGFNSYQSIFFDLWKLSDDYLLSELEKKSLDPRHVEVVEWVRENFDVKKIKEFSSTITETIEKNPALLIERDYEDVKKIVNESLKLDIVQFEAKNISGVKKVCLSKLATECGSYLIPLYCLVKNRNSTFFASASSGVDGLLYMEGELDSDDKYDETLVRNLKLLKYNYSVCSEFIEYWESADEDEESISQLVKYGESKTLEFKATAKYSLRENKDDKDLYYGIIKNICAMANTDGGIILVGYDEDNQSFNGIEKDGFENSDKWENYIRNKLKDKSGNLTGTMMDIKFITYKKVTCAQIEVRRASDPILCKELNSNKKILYVRTGASTRALDAGEIISYSKERF